MRPRWMTLETSGKLFYLIIEGDITIKKLYYLCNDIFSKKGAFIVKADTRDKEFTSLLEKQLAQNQVNFTSIGRYFWIEQQNVNELFCNTDFGESLDACFFLKDQPFKGLELGGKKMTGALGRILSIGQQVFIEKCAANDDIYVSYEDMPNLGV